MLKVIQVEEVLDISGTIEKFKLELNTLLNNAQQTNQEIEDNYPGFIERWLTAQKKVVIGEAGAAATELTLKAFNANPEIAAAIKQIFRVSYLVAIYLENKNAKDQLKEAKKFVKVIKIYSANSKKNDLFATEVVEHIIHRFFPLLVHISEYSSNSTIKEKNIKTLSEFFAKNIINIIYHINYESKNNKDLIFSEIIKKLIPNRNSKLYNMNLLIEYGLELSNADFKLKNLCVSGNVSIKDLLLLSTAIGINGKIGVKSSKNEDFYPPQLLDEKSFEQQGFSILNSEILIDEVESLNEYKDLEEIQKDMMGLGIKYKKIKKHIEAKKYEDIFYHIIKDKKDIIELNKTHGVFDETKFSFILNDYSNLIFIFSYQFLFTIKYIKNYDILFERYLLLLKNEVKWIESISCKISENKKDDLDLIIEQLRLFIKILKTINKVEYKIEILSELFRKGET